MRSLRTLCATTSRSRRETRNEPTRGSRIGSVQVAEKVGFEPTDRVTPVNALAGRPIRPLWHFSAGESTAQSSRKPNGIVADGTVAEWTIAAALKAADPQGSGGSNPSRSAPHCELTTRFATRSSGTADAPMTTT